MKVFTAQQMRDFDKEATEKYGIPSLVLMENAALRVVEFLETKFAPLENKKVTVLCGKGNNGGDGLAIARHLESSGCIVRVFLACTPEDLKGDAAVQWHAVDDFEEINGDASFGNFEPDIVLDALLGTGFKGEITDDRLIAAFDFMASVHCPVVAVDIPSGLNADTGEAAEGTHKADYTVTFADPKKGFFVRQGPSRTGEIWIGDIGTTFTQNAVAHTGLQMMNFEEAHAMQPIRSVDAHKGDAGRLLIIGGSFGMSGAVALAARAALNSGVGLCIAAMPEKILPSFAASVLEATSHPLPCDEKGRLVEAALDELPELWKNVQAVALGPGIGRSEETQRLVQRIVQECSVPLVIDADALHALPAIADEVHSREGETILTPHPGEMGTLMGISTKEVNAARYDVVKSCAEKYGAEVVLKGAYSLIGMHGGPTYVNVTGNSGMATGGSGDVLTGTIGSLVAQYGIAISATWFGVYLHGLAGDLAYETKGNGLVAGDIAAHLGPALVKIPQMEVEKINGRLRRLM
jgi:hydroxyethylthiazole kinase-like uncharacterized protein yjeF